MNDAHNGNQGGTGLVLEGLDGANPLAFLAALGVLRGLSIAWPGRLVELSWTERDAWRPCLHVDGETISQENALDGLTSFADLRSGHEALDIGDNLTLPPDRFREAAKAAAESSTGSHAGRARADFIAGFGCEAVTDRNHAVRDTALRTLRGAGHQHFLKTMRDLAECTTVDSFERCLFHPWSRSDQRLSLRWDPEDDRRYALRWRDPSKEAGGTEWGANRLAFEAISLFPVAPVERTLATTGFRGARAGDTFFTWPIWDVPVNLDTVRSILSLDELQQDTPNRRRLHPMGIREVFRSQRMNAGRYRNFSPARSV